MQGASLHRSYRFRGVKWVLPPQFPVRHADGLFRQRAGPRIPSGMQMGAFASLQVPACRPACESGRCARSSLRDRTPNSRSALAHAWQLCSPRVRHHIFLLLLLPEREEEFKPASYAIRGSTSTTSASTRPLPWRSSLQRPKRIWPLVAPRRSARRWSTEMRK